MLKKKFLFETFFTVSRKKNWQKNSSSHETLTGIESTFILAEKPKKYFFIFPDLAYAHFQIFSISYSSKSL